MWYEGEMLHSLLSLCSWLWVLRLNVLFIAEVVITSSIWHGIGTWLNFEIERCITIYSNEMCSIGAWIGFWCFFFHFLIVCIWATSLAKSFSCFRVGFLFSLLSLGLWILWFWCKLHSCLRFMFFFVFFLSPMFSIPNALTLEFETNVFGKFNCYAS